MQNVSTLPSAIRCETLLQNVYLTKGAFHLSELAGQTIPVVIRISLLIKTIQPDQSNPK